MPADNSGLGLARAAAVTQLLSTDRRLEGLKILPLSGAQVIDVDDTLSLGGNTADVKQRRRIQIRVRRAEITDSAAGTTTPQQANSKSAINGTAVVVDGDTFDIGGTRIRLWGVDAVEGGQFCTVDGRRWDCAQETTERLRKHLDGQHISCTPVDRHFERIVAICHAKGSDVAGWLVRQGLALDYSQFSRGAYRPEQEKARSEKLGLWRGAFVAPWEWRKSGTKVTAGSGSRPSVPAIPGGQ